MTQTTLTKSVVIRGHPGAGKTLCIVYQNDFIQLAQKGCTIVHCKWEHSIGIKFYVTW